MFILNWFVWVRIQTWSTYFGSIFMFLLLPSYASILLMPPMFIVIPKREEGKFVFRTPKLFWGLGVAKSLNLSGLWFPCVPHKKMFVRLSLPFFPTIGVECSLLAAAAKCLARWLLAHLLSEWIRCSREPLLLWSPAALPTSRCLSLPTHGWKSSPFLTLLGWLRRNYMQIPVEWEVDREVEGHFPSVLDWTSPSWVTAWVPVLSSISVATWHVSPCRGLGPQGQKAKICYKNGNLKKLGPLPLGLRCSLGQVEWWYHGLNYFLDYVGPLCLGSSWCEAPGSLI